MAQNSKIEWCDHTVNLWWGCSKVHTGCKNCYAEVLSDTRYQKNLWGEKAGRQRIKSAFNDLDKYQKQAASENKLLKIFCGSMMDIFEEDKQLINSTDDFKCTTDLRYTLFMDINAGKYNNLVFLFLTKRPENIPFFIPNSWLKGAPANVWFGTSVSDQNTADQLIPKLLSTKHPNLFLSLEPQIGKVCLRKWFMIAKDKDGLARSFGDLKWIIQGGESGHNKRDFDLNWAYKMKSDCEEANIPYFFKQIDKIQPIPNDLFIRQFPEFQSFDRKIKTASSWQANFTL